MARRILSADTALTPQAQNPLEVSVRTETESSLAMAIRSRWIDRARIGPAEFDWQDRGALMEEIAFVNRAQEFLDEATMKIAPSVLRIVLTVKANLAEPVAQREFLADHLALDFRRISELCILADSYRLLDAKHGVAGEREIARYGWSKALKLAHVREAADRKEIWGRARGNRNAASYRAVLEEIRRFRERKQVLPFPREWPLDERWQAARTAFASLENLEQRLTTSEGCAQALDDLKRVEKELDSLKRVIRGRIDTLSHEEMAAKA